MKMTSPSARWRPFGAALGVFTVVLLSLTPEKGQAQSTVPSATSPAEGEAKNEHGRAQNRLAKESSPYLLLHAYNPVDWYPWGEEAIARARRESKPIFLSVGYSSCYWCHVMEREAFSDQEIAGYMNRHFVNVKVDREERPELDEIYMTATQLIGGRGGWPNSVFLTPELKPFFAGTYFSPTDQPGRPGFQTVLGRVHSAWNQRRGQILEFANQVAARMEEVSRGAESLADAVPPIAAVDTVVTRVKGRFDPQYAGFGQAPKFPSPGNLLLLWAAAEAGDAEARDMVVETLHAMCRGGLFDAVGGGFHRYSVDGEWGVPHFEKMLYDNALLARLYVVVGVETRDPELIWTARRTFDFLRREMSLPGGAFKSAIDAETDGEEGAYYVWSRTQLAEALGEERLSRLAPLLRLDEAPNFEGDRYTLRRSMPIEAWCADASLDTSCLPFVEEALERLRVVRDGREYPLVDDKVLTDWNAMTIAAFATGGRLLQDPDLLSVAVTAASFLSRRMHSGSVLKHAYRLGAAKIDAFLDDYAYLIDALLELERATSDAKWGSWAERLAREMDGRLAAEPGGFYMSAPDDYLLFRARPVTDGAIPSGNSVALRAMVALAGKKGGSIHRQTIEKGLRAFAQSLASYPTSVPTLALALREFHQLGQNPPANQTMHKPAEGVVKNDPIRR